MQNTLTTLYGSNMALTALTLLALFALSHGARLQRNDPRIVNGENAQPGEIPYQVSLQNKGSAFHFCGGSVLNEYFVITAAHCVSGKSAASTQVVAGTIDLAQPHSVHDVVSIQVHEEYDQSNSWINDIALLKVRTPFVRTQQISFVSLPSPGDVVNANDIAVVSGWGRLWQGGPTTTKLQRVNILIADQEYCRYMYSRMNYNIYASHVCAFDPTAEKGSCHGDSGGPLTVDGKLTGLVSWAYGCASSEYPTVYTRVSEHLKWIEEHAF